MKKRMATAQEDLKALWEILGGARPLESLPCSIGKMQVVQLPRVQQLRALPVRRFKAARRNPAGLLRVKIREMAQGPDFSVS